MTRSDCVLIGYSSSYLETKLEGQVQCKHANEKVIPVVQVRGEGSLKYNNIEAVKDCMDLGAVLEVDQARPGDGLGVNGKGKS